MAPDTGPIAWVMFTDGPRPIYQDQARQFTYDDLGEKVHGVCFIPRDEPDEPIILGVGDARP